MDINRVSGKISSLFKKDFKKRFIFFLSIPLLISVLFLVDFFLLPEVNKNDSISYISTIKVPQSAGGTSFRTNRDSGYKYTTEANLKFSTLKLRIKSPEIKLRVTPVFSTVKTVITSENKKIDLASGFSGLNKLLFISFNSILIISVFYVLLIKKITENARLNLIFLNIFILAIWIYTLILI